jgi:DNA-binding NarL/FixJ family response regulator
MGSDPAMRRPQALGDENPLGALSPRELQVLRLTSAGWTNRRVAEDLGVSVHAVKFHLASVYRKLQVSNRTEAAAAYLGSSVRTLSAEASSS